MIYSHLELYEPTDLPKSLGENLWIVDGPVVKMAMYGTAIPFPTRMTIIRLGNGDLWCHSPIELSPALRSRVDALGRVRHLVSPNKLHYAHIDAWAKAYPGATAWASPGVRERAAGQHIEVRFDRDLGESAPAEWAGRIDQSVFRGSRFMDEVVFFHRESSTLILTDLIENFEPAKVGKQYRWLLGLAGTTDPDGKAPLDLRLTFWGRKQEARRCYRRLLEWAPERIVIAHGRCYDSNGVEELQRAFRWLR